MGTAVGSELAGVYVAVAGRDGVVGPREGGVLGIVGVGTADICGVGEQAFKRIPMLSAINDLVPMLSLLLDSIVITISWIELQQSCESA